MLSLKYDNFGLYWAIVTEKTFKKFLCKGIITSRWISKQ